MGSKYLGCPTLIMDDRKEKKCTGKNNARKQRVKKRRTRAQRERERERTKERERERIGFFQPVCRRHKRERETKKAREEK